MGYGPEVPVNCKTNRIPRSSLQRYPLYTDRSTPGFTIHTINPQGEPDSSVSIVISNCGSITPYDIRIAGDPIDGFDVETSYQAEQDFLYFDRLEQIEVYRWVDRFGETRHHHVAVGSIIDPKIKQAAQLISSSGLQSNFRISEWIQKLSPEVFLHDSESVTLENHHPLKIFLKIDKNGIPKVVDPQESEKSGLYFSKDWRTETNTPYRWFENVGQPTIELATGRVKIPGYKGDGKWEIQTSWLIAGARFNPDCLTPQAMSQNLIKLFDSGNLTADNIHFLVLPYLRLDDSEYPFGHNKQKSS